MKKALIVGIDYYDVANKLYGCVNDAYSVKAALERNGDSTINFGIKLLTATDVDSKIERRPLKDQIIELFKDNNEIALFYFSGHGYIDNIGGYLITSECKDGDDGLSLNDLLTIANDSPATNKLIILDSCHSGIAGTPNIQEANAVLKQGISILTASSENQYAVEEKGSGVFTALLVDALNGSAANLLGDITPGSVYSHIDQALGPWQQRPIFKTNVSTFVTLKKVQPPIELEDLKRIVDFFPEKDFIYPLNPSFEPESQSPVEENTVLFRILQKYNRINLLVPVDAPHMYHAAMESKACRLTVLGEHYWNLVNSGEI